MEGELRSFSSQNATSLQISGLLSLAFRAHHTSSDALVHRSSPQHDVPASPLTQRRIPLYSSHLKATSYHLTITHLQKTGRFGEAEEIYRECIMRNAANGPAIFNLRFFMMEKGDYAAAEELYSRALRLAPDGPKIMSNLVAAKSAAGKDAEAEVLLRKTEKTRKDLMER